MGQLFPTISIGLEKYIHYCLLCCITVNEALAFPRMTVPASDTNLDMNQISVQFAWKCA